MSNVPSLLVGGIQGLPGPQGNTGAQGPPMTPAGATNALQINGGAALSAGVFKYNPSNASGGLVTLGATATAATANGMESVALIDNAQAIGQASFASGHSNVSSNSWSHTLGAFNTASQVGTFVGGEEGTASGANSSYVGFNGTASTVFGYCFGNACFATGNYGLAVQNNASATRSGEYARSSGCSNVQSTHIHLARTLNTALSGTVSVTNGSPNISFSVAQTLAAGTLLVFAQQPGVIYTVLNAINASTSGTLTANYTGTTNAATTSSQALNIWDADGNPHQANSRSCVNYLLRLVAYTANGAKCGSLVMYVTVYTTTGPNTVHIQTPTIAHNDLPAGWSLTLATTSLTLQLLPLGNSGADVAAFKIDLSMLDAGNNQSP